MWTKIQTCNDNEEEGKCSMSPQLRVVLFLGAALTLLYFLLMIRKNRLQIKYSIFWAFFSLVLVLFSLFPNMVVNIAHLFGFHSSVNFLVVAIIFIIILKQFRDTIKLSSLEQKIITLTQKIALLQNKKDV